MVKHFTAIIILAASLSALTQAATYGGGTGTPDDPYQIWTPQQMNTIGTNPADWGKSFKLMADIDMSAYTGTQYNIIGNSETNFTGSFDGNGHVICNLTYATTDTGGHVGLFGYTKNAMIKNLGIEGINFSTEGCYIGGLVGFQSSGTIIHCYSTGSISSNSSYSYAGGLVGIQFSGVIVSCHSTVSVSLYSASFAAGGLVGWMYQSVITDSYSAGSVMSSTAGGLVGEQHSGDITYSYSTSQVTSQSFLFDPSLESSSDSISGGLVGRQSSGSITSSYSTGPVFSYSHSSYEGDSYSGGLVGIQNCGTLMNCYSTSPVTFSSFRDSYSGGLAGYQIGGIITSSYSMGSISSSNSLFCRDSYAGGLVGVQYLGVIKSCYNTSSINNYSSSCACTGGLAGWQYDNPDTKIEKCYSMGQVLTSGAFVYNGGLLGYKSSNSETIIACLWDTQTSWQTDGVGNVDPDSAGVTGKTTAEMKTRSTFIDAGWDFTNETPNGINEYWRMCTDGVDYPRLNWESTDADFACPDGVNTEDLDYFVSRWLINNCTPDNNYCSLTDMDFSGTVDLTDLSILAANWLKQ